MYCKTEQIINNRLIFMYDYGVVSNYLNFVFFNVSPGILKNSEMNEKFSKETFLASRHCPSDDFVSHGCNPFIFLMEGIFFAVNVHFFIYHTVFDRVFCLWDCF